MVSSIFSLLAIPAALIPLVAARTDLTGCTRTDVSSPAGASYAWYVPGTGELCDFLDCGGGRAPPKYDVPGCPQYTGTSTYSPSYLAGYSATGGAVPASTAAASASATASASGSGYGDDGSNDSDYYGDDGSDDSDYYGDNGSDYSDGDDDTEEDDEYYSTAVWRTADNPTATIHPYLVTSFPSGISTYWIPEEIETGSTTWEEVVYTTDSDGYENLVPASTPAGSDLPAICAIATNSGCGMTTSTISIPGKTISGSDASATSVTGSQSATSSLTKTFVKSVPSGLRSADEGSGGSSTSSTSASATPSQGAATGLERTFGAVGLLAAAFGALVAL